MSRFFERKSVKALFAFLLAKRFWRQVFYAFSGLLLVLVLLFLWLKIYTHHGKSFAVPDFYGMNVEQVENLTREKKLRFKIIDSVFSNQVDPGTIVDQNPFPGFRVKVNRTIFLTINAINPEMVKMPNVQGVSLRQAKAILETQGLDVGVIRYIPDIAFNNVLRQMYQGKEIEPGELILKGAAVDLVLGEGLSSTEVSIPDFIGLEYLQARDKVLDASFNLGAMIFDNTLVTEEDTLRSFVWRQRPAFTSGVRIRLGSTIDLWFTIDSTLLPQPDPDTLLIPDFDEELPDIN
jgi:eukaryotic-like serine/threonine-protein kinase